MDKKLLPLALVYANEGEAVEGRTRFQKMIFLAQKQSDEIQSVEKYDFIPYDYGPFSKELYDDIDELVERGIVKERTKTRNGKKKYFYELSEKGREIIRSKLQDENFKEIERTIEEIKSEFNSMELPKLLDIVYSRYPKYAEKSVF
ncbi:hypothetical protein AKJ36_00120 [candidate division MSBL1 archaeon SCGC-AAA259I07]|uniref:Uncharacterized protein n=1 Tax=candidate division MSBL1 archaeon SCGC-AAA259I07 TaxID=1698266 RepID=A0A133UN04_9EURY|nr:hypothetical protein AKJ36_00120 [candidate division MSBL1 archaeon SCGC-AAA259I07]